VESRKEEERRGGRERERKKRRKEMDSTRSIKVGENKSVKGVVSGQ